MTVGPLLEYGWVRTPCANQIHVLAVTDGQLIATEFVSLLIGQAEEAEGGVLMVKSLILTASLIMEMNLRLISIASNLPVACLIASEYVSERAARVAIA